MAYLALLTVGCDITLDPGSAGNNLGAGLAEESIDLGDFADEPGMGRRAAPAAPALSQPQIRQVVNQNQSRLASCVRYARNARRVDITVEVAADGRVQNATVNGGGSQLNQCMRSSITRWNFPQTGAATTTQFPFVFAQ